MILLMMGSASTAEGGGEGDVKLITSTLMAAEGVGIGQEGEGEETSGGMLNDMLGQSSLMTRSVSTCLSYEAHLLLGLFIYTSRHVSSYSLRRLMTASQSS
jgi:hypothetical protein